MRTVNPIPFPSSLSCQMGRAKSIPATGPTLFQSYVQHVTCRGHGYGAEALRLGCMKITIERFIKHINAYVKVGNEVSQKLFESACFIKQEETETINGQEAYKYVF